MPLPYCTCSVFKCIYHFHSHNVFNTKDEGYSGSMLLITSLCFSVSKIQNALSTQKASLKSNSSPDVQSFNVSPFRAPILSPTVP